MGPELLFYIPIGLAVSLPIMGGALYLFETRSKKKKKRKILKNPKTKLIVQGTDAVTGHQRHALPTDALCDSNGNSLLEPPANNEVDWAEKSHIVDRVLADLQSSPADWTIRWRSEKVYSVLKSMAASQEGRHNKVSVREDGTLVYERDKKTDAGGILEISITKEQKVRLKKAFDSMIETKMDGALNQVVV